MHNSKPYLNKYSKSKLTLGKWLTEWIGFYNNIKLTTRQVYIGHINNHIIPRIGNIYLSDINREILQDFVDSLCLSPSTVNVIFNCLKSALSSAEDRGLILNCWSKVKLPKAVKTEMTALTVDNQCRLEKALSTDFDFGVFLCLYTGLRIGELCALKWSDIDLRRKYIHVKHTQCRINGEIVFTSPKSVSSQRVIPLPDFIVDRLRLINQRGEYVISSRNSYTDVRSYRRHFKALLKKAHIPDIPFHCLRHTFATRALEVGMDIKTLSELMGHSSSTVTLNLYAHSLYEHKRSQMEKLEKIYTSFYIM